MHNIKRRHEVHHAVACINEGILHIFDAFDHEQALLLGIHRGTMFIPEVCFIRTYSHIQVTILGGLAEEFYMT